MTVSALSVAGLEAGWDRACILREINLELAPGEIVAVLGGNGSGKSSLCWAVTGLLRPRAGVVALFGRVVTGRSAEQLAMLGLRFLPQTRRIFSSLTVRENLEVVELGGRRVTCGAIRARRAAWLERFPALTSRLDEPAVGLSGGEQQLVAIGRVLSAGPRVLLLDEPTAGLAPPLADTCADAFRDASADGVAILLVEQNAPLARRLAGRILHMDQGRLVPDDPGPEA